MGTWKWSMLLASYTDLMRIYIYTSLSQITPLHHYTTTPYHHPFHALPKSLPFQDNKTNFHRTRRKGLGQVPRTKSYQSTPRCSVSPLWEASKVQFFNSSTRGHPLPPCRAFYVFYSEIGRIRTNKIPAISRLITVTLPNEGISGIGIPSRGVI
jgi:hypothetical protein